MLLVNICCITFEMLNGCWFCDIYMFNNGNVCVSRVYVVINEWNGDQEILTPTYTYIPVFTNCGFINRDKFHKRNHRCWIGNTVDRNFTHCVTLLWNMVSYSEGLAQLNCFWKHGVEENICVWGEGSNRKVGKQNGEKLHKVLSSP